MDKDPNDQNKEIPFYFIASDNVDSQGNIKEGKYQWIKFEKLDYGTLAGKQRRGELLVRLKELSGLTYREIAQLPEFCDIKLHSLAKLYKDARKRISVKKC